MAGRNAHKLVTAAGQIVNRTGKLRSISIAVTGDRYFGKLDKLMLTGTAILYKLSTALNAVCHQDLDLGFKGALHATVASGTSRCFKRALRII